MIVFDLHCENAHRFEGWFGSSAQYEDQAGRGLVTCPQCGSQEVGKAPMAPAVPAKSNTRFAPERSEGEAGSSPAQDMASRPVPPELVGALEKLAKAQKEALAKSKWVGKDFADQSRAMHYGEREEAPIHGQATLEEARDLIDDGVPVAPLPFPVAPPDELN